jgi:hypothetical protein
VLFLLQIDTSSKDGDSLLRSRITSYRTRPSLR